VTYPKSILVLFLAAGCGDDAGPTDGAGDGSCQIVDLPVRGDRDAPMVTDVALEVQETDGIVVLATATDPQGDANLEDIPQIIRVFQDARCESSPIVLVDDLVGSGVEESFGTAVPVSNGSLYSAIAAAESWPVEVDFRDADENSTVAQVSARVLPPPLGARFP
jgi:hypothetical protein